MGTGYERTDSENNISENNIIDPDVLDSEFDGLEGAFNSSTGHTHDGTTAEGGPISTLGPSQDVTITVGAILPKTDNTVSLGSVTKKFSNLFLTGAARIIGSTPSFRLTESDGTTTHNTTTLATAGDIFFIQTADEDGVFVGNNYALTQGSSGASIHRWYIDGVETMRLDSTGFGVGSATPDCNLDVEDSGSVRARIASTNNNEAILDFTRASATSYRLINNSSGDLYLYSGNLGSGSITDTERLKVDSNGDWSINTGKIVLDESNGRVGIGATTPAELLHVGGTTYIESTLYVAQNTTSSPGYGNVSVGFGVRDQGQVSASVDSDPAASFNRNSTNGVLVTYRKGGNSVGTIAVTDSGTTYNTTSDRRIKSDIKDLKESVIDQLKPRTFKMGDNEEVVKGFIADEFQEVFPNSVVGEPDGPELQTLDASTPEVIASLVYEIQELRKRVSELEST